MFQLPCGPADTSALKKHKWALKISLFLSFILEEVETGYYTTETTSPRCRKESRGTLRIGSKQELYKVTGRIADRHSWRDLPQDDIGASPIN